MTAAFQLLAVRDRNQIEKSHLFQNSAWFRTRKEAAVAVCCTGVITFITKAAPDSNDGELHFTVRAAAYAKNHVRYAEESLVWTGAGYSRSVQRKFKYVGRNTKGEKT